MSNSINLPNSHRISVTELNTILNSGKLHGSSLDIYFENNVGRIDIVFVAGLLLANKTYGTKFSINYEGSIGNKSEKRWEEISQYLQQFDMLYNERWDRAIDRFRGIENTSLKDFVASKSFAPILLINEETINSLFDDSKQYFPNKFFLLKNRYIEKVVETIPEYIYNNEDLRPSFANRLKSSSFVKTVIFCLLYLRLLPFKKGNKTASGINRTEELMEFARIYTDGLMELAKNIVEHSTQKQGVITVRIYDDTDDQYGDKILETHVFDYGEEGIITKLRRTTKENSAESELYKEDFEILKSSYVLKNFIEPDNANRLNQQLYRDIAHYGLQKFYGLIKNNQGNVASSTISDTLKRDKYHYGSVIADKSVEIGTSYFFQLPFKPELFRVKTIKNVQNTIQATPQSIDALAKILNYSIVSESQNIQQTNDGTKLILNIELNTAIKNRVDERNVAKKFEILNSISADYVAVNCKRLSLSSSSLLRILAHLSINYSQPLIVYNLKFADYDKMVKENSMYFKTMKDLGEKVPYWYEDKGILIFSLLEEPLFNFGDILYGTTVKDFNAINRIVSHTFHNSNALLYEGSATKSIENIPGCLTPYFFQSALLPFDLLLCNADNKSLFQTNMEFLVNQELNPKDEPWTIKSA